MTIIAWDGHTLAADKQATAGELRTRVTKIMRLKSGEILAMSGELAPGLTVAEWYKNGADPKEWPEFQRTEAWSRLIVASSSGAFFYEQFPVKIHVEEPFAAWGSGRDFALGAMERGATAIEAVEVASKFCCQCGLGVDFFDITPRPRAPRALR